MVFIFKHDRQSSNVQFKISISCWEVFFHLRTGDGGRGGGWQLVFGSNLIIDCLLCLPMLCVRTLACPHHFTHGGMGLVRQHHYLFRCLCQEWMVMCVFWGCLVCQFFCRFSAMFGGWSDSAVCF